MTFLSKLTKFLSNTAVVVLLTVLSYSFSFVAHADYWATSTATTSGTFIVPAGVTSLNVSLTAAGGGGGGGAFTYGGGGGGAGSSISNIIISVTPGQVIPFTVGIGGAFGTTGSYSSSAGNGGNGGNTTFGTSTVLGGNGGQGAIIGLGNGLGGIAGGIGGTNGTDGANFVGQRTYGGNGGTTPFGTNGNGGTGDANSYTLPTAGTNGNGGGAGSGWAYYANTTYHDAGARGGDGIITVVYYSDTTAPVITMNGANPLTLNASSTGVYTDLGATAFDNTFGTTTVNTIFNNVNLAATGTYFVVYSAIDPAGNVATTSRTVNVVDVTAPTITAPATQIIEATGATTTPVLVPAIAVDDFSTVTLTYSPVSFALGTTTVLWTATDTSGNVSTTTSLVVIKDTTGPAIVLNGLNPMSVMFLSTYTEPGATAFDLVDGTTTVTIAGSVNTAVLGTSTILYSSQDVLGNISTSTRTVVVVATAPALASLTIAPLNPTFTVGSSTTFVATTLDQYGNPFASPVFWGSSLPGVASINFASGLLNANATGTTVITAISGSLTATTTVTVIPATVLSGVNIINSTLGIVFYSNINLTLAQSIAASTTGTSTITNSTFSTFWNVNDSNLTNTTLNDVNVNASNITNSTLINSDITNCTVINSLVKNYFAVNCYIAFSTIDPTTMYQFINSTSTNSQIYASNIYNSIISNNSYVATSTVNASTVDASTVLTSTIATSSLSAGTVVTNSNVTLSTLVNTQLTGATSTNSILTNTVMNGGTITNSTSTGSTLTNTTVASSTLTNVVMASSSITGTVLANATTTNAVIVNGTINSGTITIGGSTYVITVPTLISSLGAVDTVAPVITVTGTNPLTIVATSTAYVDLGATSFDVFDNATTTASTIFNNVNAAVVGTYSVNYSSQDIAGNVATSSRTVNVVATPDTTAPVITIAGANPATVNVGSAYVDAGATAYDAVSGTTTVTSTSTVNTTVIGTYAVNYSSTDGAGNTATSSRVVNVIAAPDTTAPVITVLGSNPVTHVTGSNYIDAGATANDNVDGNITASIVTTNPVSSTTPVGVYTITYAVSDAAGNGATSTRTVNVVATPDTTAPVITILGSNPVNVVVGGSYVDAGATSTDNVDGNLTASIVTTNSVNTAVVGTYSVNYSVVDGAGNGATSTRTVNVVSAPTDTIAPVISITGGTPITLTVGSLYTDLGATAFDAVDGTTTATIFSNNVNTSVIGSYAVVYSATDIAGNNALATRTVDVIAAPADTIAPVISIIGGTPLTFAATTTVTYTDAGATYTDNVDGGPFAATTTSNNVDLTTIGSYTVLYTANDVAGNIATATRNVSVIAGSSTADVIPPVITITNGTPVTLTVGSAYIDQGATALDAVDGVVPATILSNSVNTAVIGSYTVVYTASDLSSNVATATRNVNVIAGPADTVAPVITITGGTPISVLASSTYTDMGATAFDAVDGTTTVVTASNNVDTNIVGAYSVVYTSTDVAGNVATATRTVNVVVVDTIAPTMTVLGANPMTITQTLPYVELGATSIDNFDGNITAGIVITGSVNTAVIGSYTITYTSTDSSANVASSTRTVNVVADTVAPVITIVGVNPATVIVGGSYTDLGATAFDAVSGTTTVNSTSTVNTAVIGSYTVTYTSVDGAGNGATSTRTVNVISGADTIAPVITITGLNPVSIVVGAVYADAGATANDNVDGNITASIVTTNTVNTAVAGAYTVTYAVSDAAGNGATSTRTVNVTATPDVTAPAITITGANPATVTVGGAYADAGATALDAVSGVTLVTSVSTVNTAVIGTYAVNYSSTDGAGNTATTSRVVNVIAAPAGGGGYGGSSSYVNPFSTPDTIAPVITMIGASSMNVVINSNYADAGAQATDDKDGNITAKIITLNRVNSSVLGTYTVTYMVSDNAGHTVSAVRTVTVVNANSNTAPATTTNPVVTPTTPVAPVTPATPVTGGTNTSVDNNEGDGITIPNGVGQVIDQTSTTSVLSSSSTASTTATIKNTSFVATVLESFTNLSKKTLAGIALLFGAAAFVGYLLYKRNREEVSDVQF